VRNILTLIIIFAMSSLSYADQMADARSNALNFGASYKNSASLVISENNKAAVPGYVSNNPEETKYYDGGNKENDAQLKTANSQEGQLLTKGIANRPKITISPNDDFLNQSKAITNNPDEVVAMLTGTYGECKPLTYSKTEYEIKTCDQYDEIDCIDGKKLVAVSGGIETSWSFPTLVVDISRRGGGPCTKYYAYTTINIADVSKISDFVLQWVRWDDIIQIRINNNPVFSYGNMNSGRCELSTDFQSSPNINLKQYLVNGANKIEMILGVGGMGNATAKYYLNYQKDKICQTFDNCKAISNECSLQTTNCLNVSSDNICNYRQNIYQCSKSTTTSSATVQCGSSNYCVNGQCTVIEDNSNNDFARSIAYLSSINQTAKDKNSADNLAIFTGGSNSCSRSTILGYNSCCTDSGWGQDFGASCSEDEKRLIQLQQKKLCHFVGSYCAKKTFLGSCQTVKKSYCCFNSKISRVIQEQGRGQLGMGWGGAESPECGGFTPQQLQKMRFDQMDLSEITSDIAESIVAPDPAYLEGKIQQTMQRYDQGQNSN